MLDHAIFLGGDLWFRGLPSTSQLPFILVNSGFDVWIINHRGTQFSPSNVRYNVNEFVSLWITGLFHLILVKLICFYSPFISPISQSFWDFCFDELSKFDLPSIFSLIQTATGVDKVHFIGFNQVQHFVVFSPFFLSYFLLLIKIFWPKSPPTIPFVSTFFFFKGSNATNCFGFWRFPLFCQPGISHSDWPNCLCWKYHFSSFKWMGKWPISRCSKPIIEWKFLSPFFYHFSLLYQVNDSFFFNFDLFSDFLWGEASKWSIQSHKVSFFPNQINSFENRKMECYLICFFSNLQYKSSRYCTSTFWVQFSGCLWGWRCI